MLAAIRPDSVNLPLMLHVLGAMLLVGALAAVAFVTILGWRSRSAPGASPLRPEDAPRRRLPPTC